MSFHISSHISLGGKAAGENFWWNLQKIRDLLLWTQWWKHFSQSPYDSRAHSFPLHEVLLISCDISVSLMSAAIHREKTTLSKSTSFHGLLTKLFKLLCLLTLGAPFCAQESKHRTPREHSAFSNGLQLSSCLLTVSQLSFFSF